MSIEGVTTNPVFSSLTSLPIGNNPIELMSYVEMLLVSDYDAQMKDLAENIKRATKLKEAYRQHKSALNDLLGKERVGEDKDKVELTTEGLALLESNPEYGWDQTMYEGIGGVTTTYTDEVAANEQADYEGDPHFNDADSAAVGFGSSDWDFQGIAGHEYLYFQDGTTQMIATHEQYSDTATVVGIVQFNITGNGTSSIYWNADSVPELNGTNMENGTTYTLADGGTALWDGSQLVITNSEGYSFTIVDNGGYLNGSVASGASGVLSDGQAPIGVLGEQFDSDTDADAVDGTKYDMTNPAYESDTHEVEVTKIEAEIERMQMRLDSLNSETELAQTELSTLTSQRKLAFETVSGMLQKMFAAAEYVNQKIG